MKFDGKVAKQYARALFELTPPAQLDSVKQALEQFQLLVSGDKELSLALTNPAVALKERVSVAQEIAKRLSAPELIGGFLNRLIENGRLAALPAVIRVLSDFIDAFKKIQGIEITSASALSSDEQATILKQIQQDLGQEARISWQVDPAIMGGLRVKAGDILLDGSVSSRLEKIRASLLQ